MYIKQTKKTCITAGLVNSIRNRDRLSCTLKSNSHNIPLKVEYHRIKMKLLNSLLRKSELKYYLKKIFNLKII